LTTVPPTVIIASLYLPFSPSLEPAVYIRILLRKQRSLAVPNPRLLIGLSLLSLSVLAQAQTQPTTYTIVQSLPGPTPGTMTVYRNGSKAVIEYNYAAKPDGTPASRALALYDLKAGQNFSWNPADTNVGCSAGTFSGDWGDPYAAGKDISDAIAKGDLRASGAETLHGIPTKVYAGTAQGMNIRAWLDEKDGLVVHAEFGAPGGPTQTLADVQKVSLTAPPASFFALPATCAGVKPPPTAAELIADETGDSGDNFVNAMYGPGSKNSCSIVLRIVAAKTMAPITRRWQAAIDTTYNQDNPTPPHYEFGSATDGTSTFAGGGLHEITSQIRNDTLRIENPPAYFNFATNFIQPGRGAGIGLIYRQCFAPTTMLYFVLKDPNDPGAGGDFLYAKSGEYATVPTH
jgi:hypothetical protein